MDKNFLVEWFGFPAALFHHDTLVLDRWLWLEKRLPKTNGKERSKLLDVGCGSGAFTIGAALRGYEAVGLTWDEHGKSTGQKRASICKAGAVFELQDVRLLDRRKDLWNRFNIILCAENIEHVINDQKLMRDMTMCLVRGGKLLLTTPNYDYAPIGFGDARRETKAPVEDGRHVRIGYRTEDLARLCRDAGLRVEELSYCSGFLSQKITLVLRILSMIHPLLGWTVILPLRPLPIVLDGIIARLTRWPYYSICLVASKN